MNRSNNLHISPRCPFGSVYKCPRYFQSLSLLGKAGNTEIPRKLDKKLQRKWSKSDIWPTTAEQTTGIVVVENEVKHYCRFCPEIAFERFHLFATNLNSYSDEIDRNAAHKKLSEESVSSSDWQWYWAHIEPQHYSECPFYSLLTNISNSEREIEDIIELKPNFMGLGINLNSIWRKFKRKYLKNGA